MPKCVTARSFRLKDFDELQNLLIVTFSRRKLLDLKHFLPQIYLQQQEIFSDHSSLKLKNLFDVKKFNLCMELVTVINKFPQNTNELTQIVMEFFYLKKSFRFIDDS